MPFTLLANTLVYFATLPMEGRIHYVKPFYKHRLLGFMSFVSIYSVYGNLNYGLKSSLEREKRKWQL